MQSMINEVNLKKQVMVTVVLTVVLMIDLFKEK